MNGGRPWTTAPTIFVNYLHIDKKVRGYSPAEIESHLKQSKLVFVKPMKVSWGGDSLMKAEMRLLTEATKTPHQYYHLISGLDLPLKTQDEIHAFFQKNAGYDFVALEIDRPHNCNKNFMDRLNYYYWFQNYRRRDTEDLATKAQRWLLKLQKKQRICRTKNAGFSFQKGSNWCSVTHETATYVLNKFPKYKKYFLHTSCPDEVLIQTILVNSPYVNKVVDNNLRYIDWERGAPYLFRQKDYPDLIQSDKLFARKFDITVDKAVIEQIRDRLLKNRSRV